MNIFLDLDGTLLDSRNRLYKLFAHLVPHSKLIFSEYWDYKSQGYSHEYILKTLYGYNQDKVKSFQFEWHNLIEEDCWLNYDIPHQGVTEKLTELSKKSFLYLVTARQNDNKVLSQLNTFGWSEYFTSVFVTKQSIPKQDLILNNVCVKVYDWIIGDTSADIQVGKSLNIRTAAVTNGFRSREYLSKTKPHLLLDSITDFNFQ